MCRYQNNKVLRNILLDQLIMQYLVYLRAHFIRDESGQLFCITPLEDLQYKACSHTENFGDEKISHKSLKASLHPLPSLCHKLLDGRCILTLVI